MSIYLPSLCLLWKLAHAVATDTMLNKRFLPDLRNLLPLVVAHLGDSKVSITMLTNQLVYFCKSTFLRNNLVCLHVYVLPGEDSFDSA